MNGNCEELDRNEPVQLQTSELGWTFNMWMCFSCTAFAALHFYFLIHANLIPTESLICSTCASVNVSHHNTGISSKTTYLQSDPLLGEKKCGHMDVWSTLTLQHMFSRGRWRLSTQQKCSIFIGSSAWFWVHLTNCYPGNQRNRSHSFKVVP